MFYMAAPQAKGKSAGDNIFAANGRAVACLLYTSPSPRD